MEDTLNSVNSMLESYAPLRDAAKSLGVRPVIFAGVVLAFAAGFLLFGIGGSFICNVVGFLYPAYESFKAVESEDSKAERAWLTYWVVYASFNLLEVFVDYILFWVPLYYILKLGFLVWLFLPSTQGAQKVFKYAVAPLLRKHRSKIDEAAENLVKEAKRISGSAAAAAQDARKKRSSSGDGKEMD